MNNINYYGYSWGSSYSGGGIFDAKLVQALHNEAAVNQHTVPVFRKWTLPIWKKRLGNIPQAQSAGTNVVSHEALHEILDVMPVDCFIVHNYFAEFDFPKLRIVNPLYRIGSAKIFYKIFSGSRRVVFLSAREMRLAAEKYPELAEKFFCQPPGHNEGSVYFDGSRDPNIIEVPGTVDWLQKKVSYWLNIAHGRPCGGRMVDGDKVDAFISVVYDSFLSGFKLKLVEMAKHGKSIVSFCDLREELASMGFEDLPYTLVRNRSELEAAVVHFQEQGDLPHESRRACYVRGSQISWARMAKTVLGN
jgi:hypothetical protein